MPVGFLQRNRLIAALSGALVVVEAKEKSGTMSTVGHAERYGKPVFAAAGQHFFARLGGDECPSAGRTRKSGLYSGGFIWYTGAADRKTGPGTPGRRPGP